jgi:small subunit ribosomal protein S6
MNEYEVLLMLDPELPEERASEIITRTRERVEQDGGTWDGHEPWGRRKLAYEIDHKTDGVYHLLLFSAGPETLAEVSRVLKIDDGVMRHLAVRRVKPTHDKTPAETKAPAEVTAPAEAAAPAEAEAPAEVAAVSEPADDAGTTAE